MEEIKYMQNLRKRKLGVPAASVATCGGAAATTDGSSARGQGGSGAGAASEEDLVQETSVTIEDPNPCSRKFRYKLRKNEETEAAKKMLQERRLVGKTSYNADYFHCGRDYVEKLPREHHELYKGPVTSVMMDARRPDDVARWASPLMDGRRTTDGRRMGSAAVVPPPHAHPRTPFPHAAVAKARPLWSSSCPRKFLFADMCDKRVGGNRFSQHKQPRKELETFKVPQGGVNGSSTCRRMLINRVPSALGLNGSLSWYIVLDLLFLGANVSKDNHHQKKGM